MEKIMKYRMSEFVKEIEKDGYKVTIEVYKTDQKGGGWILEIVDEYGNSTVWDSQFPSSKEALDAGIKVIDEEGIQSFIVDTKA
jgi:hypothetical protein